MENRNQEPNRTPRNTRRESRRATRRLVTCALLCSLATVALGMGALIEILDLTAAAVSALILFPVLLCYGGKYALLSYAVTGILGVVLMPQSMAAWMFLGLTGYYPLIKNKLDRLTRILAWISKLALLTVVMMGYLALFHFVVLGGEGSFVDSFLAGFGEAEGGAVMAWAVVGLSVFSYVLFDLLIDRLLILYYLRWQKRVEKWMGK